METFKVGVSISFFVTAHVIITSNTALDMFKNLCLDPLLLCSEMLLAINEKLAKERSGKGSDIIQPGRWRDSFSSLALCFIL